MVDKELTREIRSHKDLDKDAAPLWPAAVQFYVELAQILVKKCTALDVFACALEQSGLAEMKPAIQATGGLAVQTDTFRNPVFKDSLARIFSKVGDSGNSGRCFCGTVDVLMSRDIKIAVRFLMHPEQFHSKHICLEDSSTDLCTRGTDLHNVALHYSCTLCDSFTVVCRIRSDSGSLGEATVCRCLASKDCPECGIWKVMTLHFPYTT